MFNEAIKIRYKEQREISVVMAKGTIDRDFKKTEPFEQLLNKDVYDFTVYEIINMYKMLNFKSIDSLYVLNNRLGQYVQWALTENLVKDSQNHFMEINREMMMECINKIAQDLRIVSRQQVLNWCYSLPNASDKFVILGVFEGLGGFQWEDFWNSSINDIDREKKTIKLRNREIHISDDLIAYADESNNADKYYAMSGNHARATGLVENSKIIKDKQNTKRDKPRNKKAMIYVGIRKCFTFLNISDWFSLTILHQSGMIDYIKRRSNELGISCYDYLFSDHKREVEYQYGVNIVRSSFWTKYKEYLEN